MEIWKDIPKNVKNFKELIKSKCFGSIQPKETKSIRLRGHDV